MSCSKTLCHVDRIEPPTLQLIDKLFCHMSDSRFSEFYLSTKCLSRSVLQSFVCQWRLLGVNKLMKVPSVSLFEFNLKEILVKEIASLMLYSMQVNNLTGLIRGNSLIQRCCQCKAMKQISISQALLHEYFKNGRRHIQYIHYIYIYTYICFIFSLTELWLEMANQISVLASVIVK